MLDKLGHPLFPKIPRQFLRLENFFLEGGCCQNDLSFLGDELCDDLDLVPQGVIDQLIDLIEHQKLNVHEVLMKLGVALEDIPQPPRCRHHHMWDPLELRNL